ncbi:MAG TPA: class I SAM-dependent methyltransferase [Steroidobacteraceae bacterium]|jgi:ubiquinone/menaquinone biosynthesis C-methylase UbiE|nr:class I SAM-dependent methyltransferase [Steroidobacteraceae bacterium]
MSSHDDHVHRQFDPRAAVYLASSVHASGPDLLAAQALVQSLARRPARILDLGCGAGHLSFALSNAADEVIACDPAENMLATVQQAAHDRGIANIGTAQAHAEALPFEDGSFDIVATRYSAHHWGNLPEALREARRVLADGGNLLVSDVLGATQPLVDTHLQAMEVLRDPSHVRNYSIQEWQTLLSHAHFDLEHFKRWATLIDATTWVERMRTPPESVAAIRRLQGGAPTEVKRALEFKPDGSFTVQTGLFWAHKSR